MSDKSEKRLYLIFQSIHNVMLAEELLIEADISIEMVPVPREISSDCGMSLICSFSDIDRVKNTLKEAKFTSEVVIYEGEQTSQKSERIFKLLLTMPPN